MLLIMYLLVGMIQSICHLAMDSTFHTEEPYAERCVAASDAVVSNDSAKTSNSETCMPDAESKPVRHLLDRS